MAGLVEKFRKRRKPSEKAESGNSQQASVTSGLSAIVRIHSREIKEVQERLSLVERDMRRVSKKQYDQDHQTGLNQAIANLPPFMAQSRGDGRSTEPAMAGDEE